MFNQLNSERTNQELESYLILLEPSEALPRLVKSARDIYAYRSALKLLPCKDETINYLAKVILNAIESHQRFRKVECLKVLRTIIRNSDVIPNLESISVRLLFQVYKNLILTVSEEGQWAASVLIKGQLLEDTEIKWLIQNYRQSTHLLNRLLLYPGYNPVIAAWAEEVYKYHEFPNRETEVIALLIHKGIPLFVDKTDTNQLLEAVSRARIHLAEKEALLKKYARSENLEVLISVSLRLQIHSLNQFLIREIEKLQEA